MPGQCYIRELLSSTTISRRNEWPAPCATAPLRIPRTPRPGPPSCCRRSARTPQAVSRTDWRRWGSSRRTPASSGRSTEPTASASRRGRGARHLPKPARRATRRAGGARAGRAPGQAGRPALCALHLTDAGREALQQLVRVARQHQDDLCAALDESEREQLADTSGASPSSSAWLPASIRDGSCWARAARERVEPITSCLGLTARAGSPPPR